MMKRGMVCALAAGVLAGCAPAPVALGKLPPIANPANAGEVVVIRARAFIDGEFSYYVNINQENILALASGEHARLKLPAGEHRIAIRCFAPLTDSWKETALTEGVLPGQTRYLAVAPKFGCASLDPVSESEGRKLLSRTIFKPL